MSKYVIVVGLPVQVQSADQLLFAPDGDGQATINGSSICSLSHLPDGIAVVEFADGLVLLPWTLLNRLLGQAAERASLARGAV